MRVILILMLMISSAYAGSAVTKNWAIPTPPSVTDKNMYNFLYSLYSHFNQAQVVTIDPDGSIDAPVGHFLLWNNVGVHNICFQTDQPSGTTWKCALLS